jgi:hypothetical protein
MLALILRRVIRIAAALLIGAAPGALYAILIGAVHLGVYGRWERVPAFAVGCVLTGAMIGLLGGISWALSSKRALDRVPATSGSQGEPFLLQAPLELAAPLSDRVRVARPSYRRPRRPGRLSTGGSRGCAPYRDDGAASPPILDRRRWLAERDGR